MLWCIDYFCVNPQPGPLMGGQWAALLEHAGTRFLSKFRVSCHCSLPDIKWGTESMRRLDNLTAPRQLFQSTGWTTTMWTPEGETTCVEGAESYRLEAYMLMAAFYLVGCVFILLVMVKWMPLVQFVYLNSGNMCTSVQLKAVDLTAAIQRGVPQTVSNRSEVVRTHFLTFPPVIAGALLQGDHTAGAARRHNVTFYNFPQCCICSTCIVMLISAPGY